MDAGEEGGPLGRQEVPEGPEADGQVVRAGQLGRQRPRVGPYEVDALVGVRPRGLGQHARAQIHPGHPVPAQPPQHPQPRAGPAAHVQPVPEGAFVLGERLLDRVEHAVRGAERGLVELGREQVVPALDGREGLHGELADGRSLGSEHEPSLMTRPRPGGGRRRRRPRWLPLRATATAVLVVLPRWLCSPVGPPP